MTGGSRRTAVAAVVTAMLGLGSLPVPPAAVPGIDVLGYDVELSLGSSFKTPGPRSCRWISRASRWNGCVSTEPTRRFGETEAL